MLEQNINLFREKIIRLLTFLDILGNHQNKRVHDFLNTFPKLNMNSFAIELAKKWTPYNEYIINQNDKLLLSNKRIFFMFDLSIPKYWKIMDNKKKQYLWKYLKQIYALAHKIKILNEAPQVVETVPEEEYEETSPVQEPEYMREDSNPNPMMNMLGSLMSGGDSGGNPMAMLGPMMGMLSGGGGGDGGNPIAGIMGALTGGDNGSNPIAGIMGALTKDNGDGSNPIAGLMSALTSGDDNDESEQTNPIAGLLNTLNSNEGNGNKKSISNILSAITEDNNNDSITNLDSDDIMSHNQNLITNINNQRSKMSEILGVDTEEALSETSSEDEDTLPVVNNSQNYPQNKLTQFSVTDDITLSVMPHDQKDTSNQSIKIDDESFFPEEMEDIDRKKYNIALCADDILSDMTSNGNIYSKFLKSYTLQNKEYDTKQLLMEHVSSDICNQLWNTIQFEDKNDHPYVKQKFINKYKHLIKKHYLLDLDIEKDTSLEIAVELDSNRLNFNTFIFSFDIVV